MFRALHQLRAHFRKDGTHRKILRGLIVVAGFALLGKVAGAAKEVALAWRYGVGDTIDAFVLLTTAYTWPVAASLSVMTVILVPLMATLRRESPTQTEQFQRELLGGAILLGAVIGIAGLAAIYLLLADNLIALAPTAKAAALTMAPGLAMLVPLGLVSSLFSIWLLAHGRHLNTLLEGTPALVLLLVLVLTASPNIEPLVVGTVGGHLAYVVLLIYCIKRVGQPLRPSFIFRSPVWRLVWSSAIMLACSQILTTSTILIDQVLTAPLGSGAISVLSFANRLLILIFALGALAISRATLPIFSDAAAADPDRISGIALRWSAVMFVGGALAALTGAWFSKDIVALLFERGAFSNQNTIQVSSAFRIGLTQVPFYFASLVLVSSLAAQRRYRPIALSGVANLLVKALLAPIFVERGGLAGLMLSTTAMYLVSLVILFTAVRFPDHR